MNWRAMFPGQENLVGDREIQMGFLFGPFKACTTLKFGRDWIRWPQGEPDIEIVWFSVYGNIVHFARCTGLVQEFEVS